MWLKFLFLVIYFKPVFSGYQCKECRLPEGLKNEIKGYQPIVDQIIQETTNGKSKGFVYNELLEFVDLFGDRLAGSSNLEKSIDYMLEKLKKMDLDNVHGETVTLPKWIRGKESATLILPRLQDLPILGLGGSVSTAPRGVTAEAVVVRTFQELDAVKEKVKGKIVVFDESWTNYHLTVNYRTLGATRAAAYGAVAVLVRSVTPFSIDTPHTGWQDYSDAIPKIPAACITAEDARMLYRMYNRGQKVVINLKMEAHYQSNRTNSRNTVAEIKGSMFPEKVVLVSGHLDSWDVGQGAMDDGGGAFISWGVLVLLRKLNLVPRRTIRAVLWTGEELGLLGAFAYAEQHKNETRNFNLLMESDEGTFNPLGIEFDGSHPAFCLMQEILRLLQPINATHVKQSVEVGSDITVWKGKGVPSASLLTENEKYYWYHHTKGDTIQVQNSLILDRCLAVWASVAYVVADINVDLPRN